MTEKAVNPHDRFFKEAWSHAEVARDFLTYYLPANIVELLDIDTLELSKDSFVDKELSEYFSDLLYKVELRDGRAVYVYVLLEHKSYPEPFVAFPDGHFKILHLWPLQNTPPPYGCPIEKTARG